VADPSDGASGSESLILAHIQNRLLVLSIERSPMTVSRYDDSTWAVYDAEGTVLAYGFFASQNAWDWIEAA
jgi:hypothetical protein